jgi:hypothetical protein
MDKNRSHDPEADPQNGIRKDSAVKRETDDVADAESPERGLISNN